MSETQRVDAATEQRIGDVIDDLIATLHGEQYRLHEYELPKTAREAAERIHAADPPDLREALLSDPDVIESAWGAAHERCCEDANERDTDAWYEVLGAIEGHYGLRLPPVQGRDYRPEWMSENDWTEMLAALGDRPNRDGSDDLDDSYVEERTRIAELCADEGCRRHQAGCTRGDVGSGFHSVP